MTEMEEEREVMQMEGCEGEERRVTEQDEIMNMKGKEEKGRKGCNGGNVRGACPLAHLHS